MKMDKYNRNEIRVNDNNFPISFEVMDFNRVRISSDTTLKLREGNRTALQWPLLLRKLTLD